MEAVKETEPEVTSLPTATPVPVQEKTDTELPVLPAPTPDPERETAAVAATFMGGGEEINGFFSEGYFGLGDLIYRKKF